MARFNESEYAGYVRLMRDLKLEHTYQAGDRFGRDLEGGKIGVGIQGINVRRPEDWWLPSSDDWDEMLEAAGLKAVLLDPIGDLGWSCEPLIPKPRTPGEDDYITGAGVTRIEARAQLWLNAKRQ